MGDADLPDNVYYQSYLKKAGIRFHYNVVDSTVKKGFGLSKTASAVQWCSV